MSHNVIGLEVKKYLCQRFKVIFFLIFNFTKTRLFIKNEMRLMLKVQKNYIKDIKN